MRERKFKHRALEAMVWGLTGFSLVMMFWQLVAQAWLRLHERGVELP